MFNHLTIYLLFVKKKKINLSMDKTTYTTFSNRNININGTKWLHTSWKRGTERTQYPIRPLAKSAIKLKDFLQIDAHYLYCFKWLRKCFWLKTKGMCKLHARNDQSSVLKAPSGQWKSTRSVAHLKVLNPLCFPVWGVYNGYKRTFLLLGKLKSVTILQQIL